MLRWNGKHVWSIGTGMGDGSVVQIIPGPNDIKKADWDKIKNHPTVIARMEKDVIDPKRGKVKQLEVIEAKTVTPKGDDDNKGEDNDEQGLGDVSVKDAKAIVAETFNTDLLRKWQEDDARKGVQDAITKQFEVIAQGREDDATGTTQETVVE